MTELTRGQLADEGKVNPETVRYYEQRGLLAKPSRSAAGYRLFDAEAVRRLRFIKHAQALGFSLNEVKELLALRVRPGVSCADVCRRAEAKLASVDEKLRALRSMRSTLVRLVGACANRGPVSACAILASLDANDEPDSASHRPGRGRRGAQRTTERR
jgi:DNA-binding transcriptional MerR regulator